MSPAQRKATPKKKSVRTPAGKITARRKKKLRKSTGRQKPKQQLSEKILASNYFSDRQKQNKKIEKKKPKASKKTGKKKTLSKKKSNIMTRLSQNMKHVKKKKALKKDLKIRKQAIYLSNLPETRWKRFFYKLRPGKILRFIFSIRGLILGIKIMIILFILSATGLAVLYLHYRRDVPTSIASLQSCIEGQTTKYYDKTGRTLLWSSKSDFDCQPTKLTEVSQYLVDALIVTEDRDFYEHRGFKVEAIVRATVNNLLNRPTQGGSTLTQQYIKNAILQDSSRTYDRKIKEIILAIELERTFEKNEILTAYLNTISFGSIYSGVEAAAQGYFNKSADNLTLDEAALLIAALPAPTSFWNEPENHVARQKWVLRQMLEQGQIDQKTYEKAIKVDTLAKVRTSHEQYENIKAPHFILETEKRLTEELCDAQQTETPRENCENIRLQGYKVITTLDLEAQKIAEKTIDAVIPTIADRGFDNAALVAVDVQTGKVIAQVGSRDFRYEGFGQTNTVTQQRDPGSTFKIFDYAALMEDSSDWGPGSIFYDYETTFDTRDWTPSNYDGRHAGPITMRKALGRSLNIPAIKAMYIAGIDTVHNFAYKAGIRTKLPCTGGCGLSSSIGGGSEVRLDELTNAYATFSRNGVYLPLTYVDQVFDSEGKLLRQWRKKPERVFRAETSYLLNHMLADKSVRYTQNFNLDPSVDTVMAVKTGTDDNYINNHIVGYTKSVALGGWIGNHDETVTFETERYTTAPKALIIKTFMEAYHRNIPHEEKNHWSRPAGIKKIKIDLLTGYQVVDKDEESEDEESEQRFNRVDIFPSWYVPKISPQEGEQVVEIDTVSGKVATRCTPQRAIKAVKAVKINGEINADDAFYNAWYVPIVKGLLENLEVIAYTGEKDDAHKCSDQLPRIEIIEQPAICTSVCSIQIRVQAGTFELQQVNVINNHQILEEGSIPIEGRSQILTYDYHPSRSNSPPELRGALSIEVVDQGLYEDVADVLLNISGFPQPEKPTEKIILTSINVNQIDHTLRVNWNRPGRNLKMYFAGDCQSELPLAIEDGQTSVETEIRQLPKGECQVFLTDEKDQESNRLQFELL